MIQIMYIGPISLKFSNKLKFNAYRVQKAKKVLKVIL